jgi:hypothetical protein
MIAKIVDYMKCQLKDFEFILVPVNHKLGKDKFG